MIEVVDCGNAYEVFALKLVRMTKIGPCVQLGFAVPDSTTSSRDRKLFVIKLNLIVPIEELPTLARQLLSPIEECGADTQEWDAPVRAIN